MTGPQGPQGLRGLQGEKGETGGSGRRILWYAYGCDQQSVDPQMPLNFDVVVRVSPNAKNLETVYSPNGSIYLDTPGIYLATFSVINDATNEKVVALFQDETEISGSRHQTNANDLHAEGCVLFEQAAPGYLSLRNVTNSDKLTLSYSGGSVNITLLIEQVLAF